MSSAHFDLVLRIKKTSLKRTTLSLPVQCCLMQIDVELCEEISRSENSGHNYNFVSFVFLSKYQLCSGNLTFL